jgi:ribonucleoside-triphosphate reductase
MRPEWQEDLFDPARRDPEGIFDAQLPLPIPSLTGPEPFRTIIKRNGRQEPFAKEKIARAIALAGQAAGLDDPAVADGYAAAVAIFLSKRLGPQPPTADQVSDAVEKVLLQMAQGETALAYARYRDRRARIRQLRDGDASVVLEDLDAARHEREALSARRDSVLAARTRTRETVAWDRKRTIEALVRETGLDPDVAAAVVLEIEGQLERAGIQTLTAALLRELVDAKLVEHRLAAHRERHRRLGLPLYDCERIIRGVTQETMMQDPAGTDQALARAVKKEYALAQVFSADVAEAHLRGEIHLHQLGLIDRLHALDPSLAMVARHGIRLPGGLFAAPPRHPHTLLAQMAKYNALLHGLFAEPLAWDAVNFYFAPFLSALEGSEFSQFAQMLIYEFAYRALAEDAPSFHTELGLHWSAPDYLREAEAIGPGGTSTGKTYAQYQRAAQRFALALLDVLRQGGANGAAFPGPAVVVHIDPRFFQTPDHETFLAAAGGVAALHRGVHFAFSDNNDAAHLQLRGVASSQVSLNLPRAAFVSGTEAALFAELDRLFDVAVKAHEQKRRFLEELAGQPGGGPLGLLAIEDEYQKPFVDLEEARAWIAVDGLNECVQALSGNALHDHPDAATLAQRILEHLHGCCVRHNASPGVRLALTQNHDGGVSQRFATLDLDAFPLGAAPLVKTDPDTQALYYTSGARVQFDAELSPFERVSLSGSLQQSLDVGAMTEVPLPLHDASEAALADFIRKVFQRTANRRLVFV